MPLTPPAMFDGLRRRFADLAPREQRALKGFAVFLVVFGAAVALFVGESAVGRRERRNADNAQVLRLVREKGPAYRKRLENQSALEARLDTELPPLPSILGEVLGGLGQERQDFQELAPEPVGLPGQKKKPWTRLAVRFGLRKVAITVLFEFLVRLRDRYPNLPLAVTMLDLRLDRTEANLFNAEMVLSAYRFSEPRADRKAAGGAEGDRVPPGGQAPGPEDR